ncbi:MULTISPECIES: efflux RND transporter periplasmic adaptor subunit [unclassified Herbaspirillum]|uniref:efflux RND transporter periplasmic adaptor subunit n=1 Tax=unclassified Herbaspirillum TaxID=2624150 RepID=UPI0011537851|nr:MULTISPECIES: efflux RND transporter periplasmic adaptor subunit [unclassified Herbaspirillum]MBB5392705.1 multidrug efflux system membrane fusion protein [Herbaspirillum sp. SJZ102]TQK06340.1 multidrug efflux system membrane fusion protein [Herbaspirillum sp. SJZ130]TQK12182.1 multidrug efflux system membrane fusion protein [Herbaspirillum sp. SJZ106]
MNTPTTLRRRYALTATVLAVIALTVGGAISAVGISANASTAPAAPPAAPVDVAEVVSKQIIDWQAYSGRIEAVDRVEVRPLVGGTLTQVHFKDGALVKKGDVLFTIDPRPYAAEVARTEAQLAGAEARAGYTSADLARGQRLLGDNAIAKRDFEEKQNAAREAAASVQAAKAAVRAARLNLEYTQITAPVSGRISRAEVTVGNVVNPGSANAPLTTLVSVAKVYASFDVDEQSFLKYVNPARAAGTAVPVYLGLANEDGYSRQGKVGSVDNRLDPASGTIRVRAVFDNGDGQLIPGLYARVRLGGGAPHEAVLIDEKALGTDQDKRFVMVADKDNHAIYRQVRVGASLDGLVVVENGLKSGERIVVNGLQRIRPGDAIAPTVVPMQPQAKTVDAQAQPAGGKA